VSAAGNGRRPKAVPARPAEPRQTRKTIVRSTPALTPAAPAHELPDNVRELLDWLIDEELKRWLREEQ
jgi:hypothetical protein